MQISLPKSALTIKLARERFGLITSAIETKDEQTANSRPSNEIPGLGSFDVFLPDLAVFPMALDSSLDSFMDSDIDGTFSATEV